MRRSKKFGFLLLLISLVAISLVAPQVVNALPTVTVSPLADMPKGDYVLGRDVAASFSFAGQSVFLYGDTALSQAPGWVVNTMYRTADTNADDNISGGYNYPSAGQSPQMFIPYTSEDTTYMNGHSGHIIGLGLPFSRYSPTRTPTRFTYGLTRLSKSPTARIRAWERVSRRLHRSR